MDRFQGFFCLTGVSGGVMGRGVSWTSIQDAGVLPKGVARTGHKGAVPEPYGQSDQRLRLVLDEVARETFPPRFCCKDHSLGRVL